MGLRLADHMVETMDQRELTELVKVPERSNHKLKTPEQVLTIDNLCCILVNDDVLGVAV